MRVYRDLGCVMLVISLLQVVPAQTSVGWKGIVPLRSSRTDVEARFGQPMKGTRDTYDTPNERITITYATGACSNDIHSLWRVSKDTVTDILVAPLSFLPADQLIASLKTRLTRIADMEIKGKFQYYSRDGAIEVQSTVLEDRRETVDYFVLRPGSAGSKLKCRNEPPAKTTDTTTEEQRPRI